MANQGSRKYEVEPGDQFNDWTVVDVWRDRNLFLRVRCKCGCERTCIGYDIVNGKTKKCRKCSNIDSPPRLRHGYTKGGVFRSEYRSWSGMIQRCYYHRDLGYAMYGGRGIVVCPRWRDSFDAFIEDMGNKPTPQHSIERIDTNGNYEPGNCRWATPREQSQNTRRNVRLSYAGETLCLSEWSRRTGINRRTIAQRLRKGWSAEAILTTPVCQSGRA